jgi:hypothetical protein
MSNELDAHANGTDYKGVIETLRKIADLVEGAGGVPRHVRGRVIALFDGRPFDYERRKAHPAPALTMWYNAAKRSGNADFSAHLRTAIAAVGGILSNGNRPYDRDWPRQLRFEADWLERNDAGAVPVPAFTISDDGLWAQWGSERFEFRKGQQAAVVQELHNAGGRVTEKKLGGRVNSDDSDFRISKLFRTKDSNGKRHAHPALHKMIVSHNDGTWELAPPPIPEKS